MTGTDIWWVGFGESNTITSAQWAEAGIDGSFDVSWNSSNGWSIPESTFTDDQVNFLDQNREFVFGQDGPRMRPGPASSRATAESSYVYAKKVQDIYDLLVAPDGTFTDYFQNQANTAILDEIGEDLAPAITSALEIAVPSAISDELASRGITVEDAGEGTVQFKLGGVDLGSPFTLPSATWTSIISKPEVIAAGEDVATARASVGADSARGSAVRPETIDFSNGLAQFRNLLRYRENGGTGVQLHIAAYGDSITTGANAGTQDDSGDVNAWVIANQLTWLTQGWVGVLRSKIYERFGNAGTGVVFLVDTVAGFQNRDLRHAFTGTWTDATYGPFLASCKKATSSAVYTFTPTVDVDSFTVYVAQIADGGACGVKIDGVSVGTISCNGSNTYAHTTFDCSDSGVHTLTVTAPSSGYAYIMAVEGGNSDGLVKITQCGRGGASTATIVPNANAVGSLQTAFDMIKPDLSLIFYGMNREATTVYEPNLQTLITQAQLTGSALVMAPFSDNRPEVTPSLASANRSVRKIAKANKIPVLSLFERWGTWAQMAAQPYAYFGDGDTNYTDYVDDTVHPNSIGHKDIGESVFEVLTNGAQRTLPDIDPQVIIQANTGSPAGAAIGRPGYLYLRTDGGDGLLLYGKVSGIEDTAGWVPVGTPLLSSSPEGVRNGNIGDLLRQTDGTFWRKVSSNGGTTGWCGQHAGAGSPEGVVTAKVGDTYARLDGSPGATTYVKESGTGNTGWLATGASVATTITQTALTEALSATGFATLPRAFANSSVQPSSGQERFGFFTAPITATLSNIIVVTSATPAAATPTLIQFGLWTVDSSDNITALVASTPNDTTLLAAANTAYTKAFSTPYGVTAGQRYAWAPIVISSATMPSFVGGQGVPGGEVAIVPRLNGTLGGQSALASSVAVGLLGNSSITPYARFS